MITKLPAKLLARKPFFGDLTKVDFSNVWIAGGEIRDAVSGKDSSDVDIFGTSKEDLDSFVAKSLVGGRCIYQDDKVKTFIFNDKKIQIIYRLFNSLEECLENFDFTICQFGWDGEDAWATPDALYHLGSNKLVTAKIHSEFAVDTLRRMAKYSRKGFEVCGRSLKDLTLALRSATDEEISKYFEFYPYIKFD